jgi:hypothetical protein
MSVTSYQSRMPLVDILDESGNPTGKRGQRFGRKIDPEGNDTGEYAVMLTSGGQGLEYVPVERCQIVSGG